jgi:hypothetical protein
MEKKYEKNLGKLSYELSKLKKSEGGEDGGAGNSKAMFGKGKDKGMGP